MVAIVSLSAAGLGRFWTLDVTDQTRPRVLGSCDLINYGTGANKPSVVLARTRNLALVGALTSLWVIDVSSPALPRKVGSVTLPGTVNSAVLSADETLAFVADGTGDLQVVSIANPASPSILTGLSLTGVHVDIALAGPLAYLVNSVGTLTIVNVSTPSAPVFVTSRAPVAGATAQRIAVEGTRAAVLANDSLNSVLQSWNTTVPSNPVFLGSAIVGPVGTGKGVTMAGGRAYVAASAKGLQSYDLSGVGAPVLLDSVLTVGGAVGVAVSGLLVFVADLAALLSLVRIG